MAGKGGKHAKSLAILASRLVNNSYIITYFKFIYLENSSYYDYQLSKTGNSLSFQ